MTTMSGDDYRLAVAEVIESGATDGGPINMMRVLGMIPEDMPRTDPEIRNLIRALQAAREALGGIALGNMRHGGGAPGGLLAAMLGPEALSPTEREVHEIAVCAMCLLVGQMVERQRAANSSAAEAERKAREGKTES